MVFNSFVFAVFFLCFYGVYLLSARRVAVQNLLLLAGSYFFYGWWDWRFLGLIWLSTVVDYLCGRELDRRRSGSDRSDRVDTEVPRHAHSRRGRRILLSISVVANLGILGVFKYFDFFAVGCVELLEMIGIGLEPRLLNVILPVGISFYTFQTLSYTIDVYRGRIRAQKNLLNFAVFVAFFPQLVAGPILRARDFLPQVARPRRLQLDAIYEGGYLILWGLFKKVVIADNLAIIVDRVFGGDGGSYAGGAVVVAAYAFAVQIYCDFSGYTDMARGLAKMMGFDICLNFDLPYFASNPVDFWRRWHMSLSTWFRDYLYIPLGGNRRGPRRTCINLMLTMALCGLWHGAALTFVLWGVYHGVLLIGYRLIQPGIERWVSRVPDRFRAVVHWAAVAGFFQLVCLGWLMFRADSVGQMVEMARAIFTPWPWWILAGADTVWDIGLPLLLVCVLPLLAVQIAQRMTGDRNVILRMPAWARGLVYTGMFYGVVVFGAHIDRPFIYFEF